jgi:hypothetical protein
MQMMKQQPKLDEMVLFCGHEENEPFHLFSKGPDDDDVEPEVQQLSDGQGRTLAIRYVILCDKCNESHCDNPLGVNLKPMIWNVVESVFAKYWKN